MATFAQGLGAHLESKKKPTKDEQRVLTIVNARPSLRRTIVLRLMEERVRRELGYSAKAKIDWSQIDWAKVFDFILKLLAILGPLLV